MSSARLEEVAARYDALAAELESARDHARTAASHFRAGEVPRGCAHAFALEGHLHKVRAELDALAMLHAERSQP